MAVLKANAYGHGLEAVARCLAPQADAFGVALVEEGIALRRLGIRQPDPRHGRDLDAPDPALPRARPRDHGALARAAARRRGRGGRCRGTSARVHLKIDTGMERIGVHHYSAQGLLEAAARSPHVRRRGHLLALRQRRRRRPRRTRGCSSSASWRCCASTSGARCPLPLRHIANSAAILRLPESTSTWCGRASCSTASTRTPGAPRAVEVRPALSWRSRVVYFKVVEPGSPVSYGSTWRSDHRVRAGDGAGRLRRRLLPLACRTGREVILRGRRQRAGRARSAWTR